MGAEARCTLRFGGQTAEGTALLETEELVFRPTERGGLRLVIRLTEIQKISAQDGALVVHTGGKKAVFTIGAVADKWLKKIQNPRSRLDKLGVKPEHRVALRGAFDSGFMAELFARTPTVDQSEGRTTADIDILFMAAERRTALAGLPAMVLELKKTGAIWVVRPKGSADIREDEVREAARTAGLVDVKVVAFSTTHTAEKLVIPVARR